MGLTPRTIASIGLAVVLGPISWFLCAAIGTPLIDVISRVHFGAAAVTLGLFLSWAIAIGVCSLPIAVVARTRAPVFGILAAVSVAVLMAVTFTLFGGDLRSSNYLFLDDTVIVAVLFPGIAWAWSRCGRLAERGARDS